VTFSLFLDVIFMVVGGLSIFLLGMNNMSNGMQAIAGNKMRTLVGAVTQNRFFALTIGFLVTVIIQSSSVTTVMVVGFVNAGIMSLTQALGVILGANIGTTITGWILVLKIGKYGLPLLGFCGLFYLFSKNERNRYIARMIMGIGMVFFGLELMKNGFKPIRDVPEFLELFSKFSPETLGGLVLSVFTGAFLTAVIQSSSAAVGIVMGMATTGVIGFDASVALVLGMNVGTTITAFLASMGTNTNAKRTAYGHTLVNVLGCLFVLPFFSLYLKLIPLLAGVNPGTAIVENGTVSYPYIIRGIAIAHSVFNVISVVIFIPFISPISKLLIKLAPEKPFKEKPRLTKLDIRMLESPLMVIEQSRNEILNMGQNIEQMLQDLRDILESDELDEDLVKQLFLQEERIDIIQSEISNFLMDTIAGEIPNQLVHEAQSQLRMADEYESVSDYIINILKLYLKLRDSNIKISEKELQDICHLHDKAASFFTMVQTAILERNPDIADRFHVEGKAITRLFRDIRTNHLEHISQAKTPALLSVSYMNMLNAYRRIKDHVENVAEAFVGEK